MSSSDQIAHDIGLRPSELTWLLEAEVEKLHLERGEVVRARVTIGDDSALEVIRLPGWGRLHDERVLDAPLHPNEEEFRRIVDAYAKDKTGRLGWEVARAKCVALHDSYSLVVLQDHPILDGEMAVLPHQLLASLDRPRWGLEAERYVAVFQPRPEQFDGAESWRKVGAQWIATRRNSIFLRSLVLRCLGRQVRSEIVGDLGMLILEPNASIAEYIGKEGANARALADLAGLTSVVVAREPLSRRAQTRLTYAIEQLCGIKEFELVAPQAPSHEWRVRVSANGAKRLASNHGFRLTMIMRLAGVLLRIEEIRK